MVYYNGLLKHLNQETSNVEYTIDRSLDSCRTPKCNRIAEQVLKYFGQVVKKWCEEISTSFLTSRQEQYTFGNEEISLSTVCCEEVAFNPVLFLFGKRKDDQ